MTFTEALGSQNMINKYMKDAFGQRFGQWGVQVERMELLDMTPKAGWLVKIVLKSDVTGLFAMTVYVYFA